MNFFKKKKKVELCNIKLKSKPKSLLNELSLVLDRCLKPQYKLFKIYNKLGEGSFGKVYKAIIKRNNSYTKVAVKYIGADIVTLQEMRDEFNYSLQMGKNNLGPKIYKVFLYKDYSGKYRGIIVMEYMDLDGLDVLDSSLSIRQKKLVIFEMLSLIHKSASIAIKNNGVFCFDIKPMNFMVNIRKGKVLKVRLIDFGSYHCDRELKSIKNLRQYVKNSKNPLIKSISKEKDTYLVLLLSMIGSIALFWRILDILSNTKKNKDQNKIVLRAILPHIQTLCRDPRLRMGISIILQKEVKILNVIMYYSLGFQITDLMNPSKSQYKKRIEKYLPNWRELSNKERGRDVIEIVIGELCRWGRKHAIFHF